MVMSGDGMRSNRTVVAAMIVSNIFVACRTLVPNPDAARANLIIVPGARAPTFTNVNDGEVSYTVLEPYPGERMLQAINDGLRAKGWTPLKHDPFTPGRPSSHQSGWGRYQTADGQVEHQWLGSWTNAAKEIVTYSLVYRASPLEAKLATAEVKGAFLSAQSAAAIRSAK